MAVAYDGSHAGKVGQFLRSALGVTARSDDASLGVQAMRAADVGAGFAVGFGGDAAGVDDDYIGEGLRAFGRPQRIIPIASPSARAARQPKFTMWKVSGTGFSLAEVARIAGLAAVSRLLAALTRR